MKLKQKVASVFKIYLLLILTLCLPNIVHAFNASEFTELEQQLKLLTPVQAITHLTEIRSIIDQSSVEVQARYHFVIAQHLEKTRQLDEAITHYDLAIKKLTPFPVSSTLVDSYIERSFAQYLLTNDPEIYCPDRRHALSLSKQLTGAPQLVIKTLTANSYCNNTPDTLHIGLEQLQQALALAEKHQASLNRRAVLNNATGNLFLTSSLYQRAYESFHKAYELWRTADDKQDIFTALHNMIQTSIRLGNWEIAEQDLQRMFELTKIAPEFKDFSFFTHYNAGSIAIAREQYAEAIKQFSAAIELQETTTENFYIATSYGQLAIALFNDGELEQAAQVGQVYLSHSSYKATKQQIKLIVGAIMSHHKGESLSGIQQLMSALSDLEKKHKKIVRDNIHYSSLDHQAKLIEFENNFLANKLAINQLNLQKTNDSKKIADLTIGVITLLFVLLIAILCLLIYSRRHYIEQAHTDHLTQIANKGQSIEIAGKLLAQSKQKKQTCALLLLDIDRFKTINDSLGHLAGDIAIQLVTKRIRNSLKHNDLIGRIGGDEFLILLTESDFERTLEIAERLRAGVANTPLNIEGQQQGVTISIGGVVISPDTTSNLTQLIKQADQALYDTKELGRDCTKIIEALNG